MFLNKIQTNPLFSGITQAQAEQLAGSPILKLSHNEILREVDKREYYFLVLSGNLVVLSDAGNELIVLDHLGENDIFGKFHLEKTYFKAIGEVQLLKVSRDFFSQASGIEVFHLFEKLHSKSLTYVEKLETLILEHFEEKRHLGIFLIYITAFFSLFMILVPFLNKLASQMNTTVVTSILVFLGTIFLIYQIKKNGESLTLIGIHRKNLKKSLFEAFFLSLGLIACGLILKIVAVTFFFPNKQVFNLLSHHFLSAFPKMEMYITLGIYCIHAIFQEILVRGGVQGIFQKFIKGKQIPILLASIVFACAHSFFGWQVVVAVFFPGLFWGWLYDKQGNIFGAALSHMMLGSTFLFFVGF